MGTTFLWKSEENVSCRTITAQISGDSRSKVKFPHTVHFRSLAAKIYGTTPNYPFYRLAYRVAGERVVRSFQAFTAAKKEAETKLREMAKGNHVAGLSAKESEAALAIRDALEAHRQGTGRKISALEAVQTFIAADKMLPDGSTMLEAIRSFCQSLATVQLKPLAAAVEEFNAARQAKTISRDGKRPQLASSQGAG